MAKPNQEDIARYADMFAAMGTEPRLRIMRLLLSAHPEGMVVGEIAGELGSPPSTLSHHLEKLKNEGLVKVSREGTYLWLLGQYAEALQELLGFLYAECCTRNKAIEPQGLSAANKGKPMSTHSVKEIVKEKYGEAARVRVRGREFLLRRERRVAGRMLRSDHLEPL